MWPLVSRKVAQPPFQDGGFLALDDLSEGPPRAARQHWESLRRGRLMPAPDDLDPVNIPHLLSHSIIVKVVPQPLDFVYKVVGQEFVDIFDINPMGLTVAEFARTRPPNARAFTDIYARVYRERRPFAYSGMMGEYGRSLLRRECVWLPFSRDGENVERIWCGLKFEILQRPL